MKLTELTQQQMKEIMLRAYQRGNEAENMGVKDLIDEIKEQILSAVRGK